MNYGFEFRDANGVRRLQLTEAMPRVIHAQRFPSNFAGSITVSGFDSDFGMFYCSHSLVTVLDGRGFLLVNLMSFAYIPSLSWDNTTKTMTIGPRSLPPGFYGAGGDVDYWLVFLGLHQRVVIN